MVMKKIMALGILCLVLLSFNAGAGWQKIWDGPVGAVVVKHELNITETGLAYPDGFLVKDETKLFATRNNTGDIYRYTGTGDQWQKIGNPGRMFVTAGHTLADPDRLYGLDPAGMGVHRFKGTPDDWTQVGYAAAEIYGGGDKLYATNPDTGNIYEYTGTSDLWIKIGGPGKMFATAGGNLLGGPDYPGHINPSKLYGLSPDGVGIWEYSGTPEQWDRVSKRRPYSQICGGGHLLLAIDSSTGDVYKYGGEPNTWQQISGPVEMFAVDPYYAFSPSGSETALYRLKQLPDGSKVSRYDFSADQWRLIPTARFEEISAICAGGGELYVVTAHGSLFQYVD